MTPIVRRSWLNRRCSRCQVEGRKTISCRRCLEPTCIHLINVKTITCLPCENGSKKETNEPKPSIALTGG